MKNKAKILQLDLSKNENQFKDRLIRSINNQTWIEIKVISARHGISIAKSLELLVESYNSKTNKNEV